MMFYENDMMRILRESEKYNIMLLFASEEEALSAANNFRKAMTESIKEYCRRQQVFTYTSKASGL